MNKHNWDVQQIDDRAEGVVGVVLTVQARVGGFIMQDTFSAKGARELAVALTQAADSLAPIENPPVEPPPAVDEEKKDEEALVAPNGSVPVTSEG